MITHIQLNMALKLPNADDVTSINFLSFIGA